MTLLTSCAISTTNSADRNWKLFVHTCRAVRLVSGDSRKSEHSPAFCNDLVPSTGHPTSFETKWPRCSSSVLRPATQREFTMCLQEFCSSQFGILGLIFHPGAYG